MAQEDLDSLGFSKDVKIVPAKEEGTHETGMHSTAHSILHYCTMSFYYFMWWHAY